MWGCATSDVFGEVCQYAAQFFVGGGESTAAFAKQFGGAACVGREAVYVALVALHHAQY